MKTELRVKKHERVPGALVFEVWYNNQFIATVTGADGPGVRIISSAPLSTKRVTGPPVECIETHIGVLT